MTHSLEKKTTEHCSVRTLKAVEFQDEQSNNFNQQSEILTHFSSRIKLIMSASNIVVIL